VQTILKEDFKHAEVVCKNRYKSFDSGAKTHVACCQDGMENEEGSNFLQRVITGDESWIFEYYPETKR
jgi:hypothetical protein